MLSSTLLLFPELLLVMVLRHVFAMRDLPASASKPDLRDSSSRALPLSHPLFRTLLARLLAGKKRRAPYWETIVTALLTSSIGYCTEKKGGEGGTTRRGLDAPMRLRVVEHAGDTARRGEPAQRRRMEDEIVRGERVRGWARVGQTGPPDMTPSRVS